MDREFLKKCLLDGDSSRVIGEKVGLHKNTVNYWVNKYQLKNCSKFRKRENFLFGKIDSLEKAYVLGFILADGAINKTKDVEISIGMKDKEVIEFICDILSSNIIYDHTFDKSKKRFPRVRTTKRIKDISTFTSGELKKDRTFTRVKNEFERYLLLGFFDGDGCVTFGKRKDRNRIWQKISFTSSFNLLIGVQKTLTKIGISSSIRPKKDNDCFVLEFSSKQDVLIFLNYIYPNDSFVVLNRKYLTACALRLELEENGGTINK